MEEVGSRGGGSKIRRADACSAGMPREGDAVFLAVPPCVQLDGFRFGGVSFARSFGVGPPVDLGILRAGSGSGRAKKSPVFFLAARARPDPVAGP